jgi:hypothetical protein
MDSNIVTIEQEVLRWPGVTSAPGRFGAVAFRYGKREIGHIHRDRIADLPVTGEMRESILAGGRARPHRAGVKLHKLPGTGSGRRLRSARDPRLELRPREGRSGTPGREPGGEGG